MRSDLPRPVAAVPTTRDDAADALPVDDPLIALHCVTTDFHSLGEFERVVLERRHDWRLHVAVAGAVGICAQPECWLWW
jgi:hypothetical protein